jgi:TMEM175 potassium channel family protein
MSDMRADPLVNERERDFERLLTFVDAIVAIAITLLVLPHADAAGELRRGGSAADLVGDNAGQIGAFFLTFLVIANLWLAQHRVLRPVIAAGAWLTRLLLLWALTIVVLPFPTALVAGHDAGDQATTKLLYIGTMAASSLVLSLVCLEIRRHPALRDSRDRPDVVRAFATFVPGGAGADARRTGAQLLAAAPAGPSRPAGVAVAASAGPGRSTGLIRRAWPIGLPAYGGTHDEPRRGAGRAGPWPRPGHLAARFGGRQ